MYASSVWNPDKQHDIIVLERVLRSAMKLFFLCNTIDDYNQRLIHCKLLHLMTSWHIADLCLAYKLVNNQAGLLKLDKLGMEISKSECHSSNLCEHYCRTERNRGKFSKRITAW